MVHTTDKRLTKNLSMSRIKEIVNILYPNQGYNHDFVHNSSKCRDCDGIPKVENAGELVEVNGDKCIVMHNGVMVYEGSYHTQWMTDTIKNLKGHHEPQEEKLFYEILKYIEPNSLMVECGSFWAYYSLWFHKEIEGAKNILIEPNPYKCEISQLNFKLNNFDGTFINGYISNTSADESFFTDWDGKEYKIKKVSIDPLFEKYNLDRIHILHADIQHHEMQLLMGASNSLKNELIDFVFLGTHSDNKKFKDYLQTFGYEILCDFEVNQSFADDGLIVACSPTIHKKINLNNFIVSKK